MAIVAPMAPAIAAIQRLEEAPQQVLVQSRHSLRDDRGRAWQTILFRRVANDTTERIDLRLVGFPEVVAFSHPRDLAIALPDGTPLYARDRFADSAPAPNVGQYDLQSVLPMLPQDRAIVLDLPLTDPTPTRLKIPGAVVWEWQQVARITPNARL